MKTLSGIAWIFVLLTAGWPAIAVLESQSEGRNFQVYRIGTEDGLSQGKVNAIVQDAQGYLWFGTQEGLNRYDGQKLKRFYHDSADRESLAADWIWDLEVDRRGQLWVATSDGLSRYNPFTEAFINVRHEADNPRSVPSNRIRTLHASSDDGLWVGTEDAGLCRLDLTSLSCERYRFADSAVTAVQQDLSGTVWAAHLSGGIFRLTAEATDFEAVPGLPARQLRGLYLDEKGQLWIASFDKGLYRYNPASGQFVAVPLVRDDGTRIQSVRALVQGEGDSYWVATDQGLVQRWKDGRIMQYRHDAADNRSLSTDPLLTLHKDRVNNLWIGSYRGVNLWNSASDSIRYLDRRRTGLKSDLISALAVDAEGNRWIGVYPEGLMVVDPAGTIIKHFNHNPEDAGSLSDGRVMSVVIGADGTAWVGTREGGLNELPPGEDRFIHHLADASDETKLAAPGVAALLIDRVGQIWVGTHGGGLHRYAGGRFHRYRHDPADPNSLSSDRIFTLTQDRRGAIWVGTEDGGLNRFDPETEQVVRMMAQKEGYGFANPGIWHLHESGQGDLWVGTAGGGLGHLAAEENKNETWRFVSYTSQSHGLVSNTVTALVSDQAGRVWLSTNRGLTVFQPGVGVLRHFDHQYGLRGNEFHQGLATATQTGQLMFGSDHGVVIVDPEIVEHGAEQALSLAVVASSNDSVLRRAFSDESVQSMPIELVYPDYSINFEFAAMEFASPENIRYQIKLHGFDTAWQDPGEYQQVRYTNLAPGDYVFEVRARNASPGALSSSTALRLRVVPPPWRSDWAYGLYGLAGLLLALGILALENRRRQRLATQRKWLELQVSERTAELELKNRTLNELNNRLREASLTDPLTNLRNRRFFYETIDKQIAHIDRRWSDVREGLAPGPAPSQFFMMIDLDGFKSINDTHGHQAGDAVLQKLAEILTRNCRQSDVVCRWGGDEFMITGQLDVRSEAEILANRVCAAISEHQFDLGNGYSAGLSASIGVTHYPFTAEGQADQGGWQQVADLADRAAYLAKTSGKDRWVRVRGSQPTDLASLPSEVPAMLEHAKRQGIGIFSSIDGELAA